MIWLFLVCWLIFGLNIMFRAIWRNVKACLHWHPWNDDSMGGKELTNWIQWVLYLTENMSGDGEFISVVDVVDVVEMAEVGADVCVEVWAEEAARRTGGMAAMAAATAGAETTVDSAGTGIDRPATRLRCGGNTLALPTLNIFANWSVSPSAFALRFVGLSGQVVGLVRAVTCQAVPTGWLTSSTTSSTRFIGILAIVTLVAPAALTMVTLSLLEFT